MILTVLVNFHRDIVADNWMKKIQKHAKGNVRYLIQESRQDKFVSKRDEETLLLPVKLENELLDCFQGEDGLAYYSTMERIEALEQFFDNIISKLVQETQLSVVYSLYRNSSLENVCREKKIPMKYIECSAIREATYFSFELCWFLDRYTQVSAEEGQRRYREFENEKNELILRAPFTAAELLAAGLKSDELMPVLNACLVQSETYDIGFAMGPNHKELSGGWDCEHVMCASAKLDEKLTKLFRPHPGWEGGIIGTRDRSLTSIEFIRKCKTIVSFGSNIAFEAMLLGKNVIDLQKMVFADKVVNVLDPEQKCTYDDWYLNFLFFSIYVPLELLFDDEYVRWRCYDNPKETAIFNKHFNYICEQYLHINCSELLSGEDRLSKIIKLRKLNIANSCRSGKLGLLRIFSQVDWKKHRVIICGCGVDAPVIKEIVENLGGNVEEFLIMEESKRIESFVGKKVVVWGESNYDDRCIFIISQRNLLVQTEVLLKLSVKGIRNIICL